MRAVAVSLALLLSIAVPVHAQQFGPSPGRLGSHPYGSMEMMLEKTWFQFDVVRVRIDFPPEVGRQFERVVAGRTFSSELADSVASVALGAPRLQIRVKYQRSVSLDRYMEAVRSNLGAARDAGVVSEDDYRAIADSLAEWYRPLADRGFRRGDLLHYDVTGDTVDVSVIGPEGETLYTHRQVGRPGRLGVLGGYFAPGTDFREPLVRSLVRRRGS